MFLIMILIRSGVRILLFLKEIHCLCIIVCPSTHMHARVSLQSEEGTRFRGAGITDGCQLQGGLGTELGFS